MRLLLPIIVIALLCAGCCAPRLDWAGLPEDQPVLIELLDQQVPADDGIYEVRVRFYERTEFEGLLQEIRFGDGTSLVEYFRMSDGRMDVCHKDIHSKEDGTYDLREIFLYPANVTDVDYEGNFAMLPENMDGSVLTRVGPRFNEDYRKDHAVKGRVLSAAPELGLHWKIEYMDGKLTVTLPEAQRARRN